MSRTVSGLRTPALLVLTLLGTSSVMSAPKEANDIKESKDAVKIMALAEKPDDKGNQIITITLDIAKPWHLYANPVGNPELASAQTLVGIKGKAKPDDVKIDYPAGKVKLDKDVGNYKIYEDKVVIKANVHRAKDDVSPLEISIHIQACDSSKCLMPSEVKIPVEAK